MDLEFPEFRGDTALHERNLLEKDHVETGRCPGSLERTLKNFEEFWLTILSEAKRPQIQCLSPEGEFWICSEANCRVIHNSFQ